jgi:Ca-activated chloride channel family protein
MACFRALFVSLVCACAAGMIGCSMMNQPCYSPGTGQDMYYPGTEKFAETSFNPFVVTVEDSLSTFGVDVDAASYTFGRKKINEGVLPPPASVRIEEYINYFQQDYAYPTSEPFSISCDGAPSPFRGDSLYLLRIGLRGRQLSSPERKPWNMTFLIDISGSMESRLPLVKSSLHLLVDSMQSRDKISLCTYSSTAGTLLQPTTLGEKDKNALKGIIDGLSSSGSTAMGAGLQNAYQVNMSSTIDGGVNRIVVCSDGDANVGSTTFEEILELIGSSVDKGVTLSMLGFGEGNFNDLMMEQLADKGNGNYYYIDSELEAARLFGGSLTGMMEVIAKDVKVQVEFNPQTVQRYRLIGYENRTIADQNFTNSNTDAGEIGAGHTVTALYEIQWTRTRPENIGIVHVRYKTPDGIEDIPLDEPILPNKMFNSFSESSKRFQFTAAISEFAEILRHSPYTISSLHDVQLAASLACPAEDGRDTEVLELIRKAETMR